MAATKDYFQQTRLGSEYLWTVIEPSTDIELAIKRTGVMYRGEFTVPFLNVEHLNEPIR